MTPHPDNPTTANTKHHPLPHPCTDAPHAEAEHRLLPPSAEQTHHDLHPDTECRSKPNPDTETPSNPHPDTETPSNPHPDTETPSNPHPDTETPSNPHPDTETPSNPHPETETRSDPDAEVGRRALSHAGGLARSDSRVDTGHRPFSHAGAGADARITPRAGSGLRPIGGGGLGYAEHSGWRGLLALLWGGAVLAVRRPLVIVRIWASGRWWRELAYVVVGPLLRLPAFVLAVLGIAASALSVVIFGLALLAGVLILARRVSRYFRWPARKLLRWDWALPKPASRNPLADNTAWRGLAYCFLTFLLIYPSTYLVVLSLAGAIASVTYPAWWFLSADPYGALGAHTWVDSWFEALRGVGALLLVPWFVRLVVFADSLLVRGLLQPTPAARRIEQLEAGRTALQADAAALLRRVERDLHDGTQARLVTLGVQLARIERRSSDPAVRDLAADSRHTVTEALTELRDIVRGLHPPALDDGLAVALSTLAGRSAVPAEVTVSLTGRPPDATASAVYFTVAELLTNVARHAQATRATITLTDNPTHLILTVHDNGHGGARPTDPGNPPGAARPTDATDPPADTTGGNPDGTAVIGRGKGRTASASRPGDPAGGSTAKAGKPDGTAGGSTAGTGEPGGLGGGGSGGAGGGRGTGLAGLVRRAAALDGELVIASPEGGPTTVTMTLPREY